MGVTGMNFLVQQINFKDAYFMRGDLNDIRVVALLTCETGYSSEEITRMANSDTNSAKYSELLDLIFKYGQNEFQESRTNRSVSVGDIIHIPFQDRNGRGYRLHEVLPQGFKTLTEVMLVNAIDLRHQFKQTA